MSNESNVKAGDPRNPSVIGRVSVWFKKTGADLFKEFGNIIDPNIAVEIERLAHFSTRRGSRAKDREEISSRQARLNFQIDEINQSNLQMMFGSNVDADEDTLDLSEGKIFENPGTGLTIDVGDTDIKSVVVRSISEEGTEVTYEEGATKDYTVNLSTGVISIVAAGGGNTALLADEDAVPEIHVQYDKEVDTESFEGFTGDEIKGVLKFQCLPPNGPQWAAIAQNAIVKANGDISLGDGADWTKMSLTVEMLEDNNGKLVVIHNINEGQI